MSGFFNALQLMSSESRLMFFWLIILVLFLVIEIITLGLTTIWFAGGALVAFVAAMAGAPETVQIILFFVVSFVLLFFTRPVVQKKLNNSRAKTNVNSMEGKEAKVIETIDNFNQKGKILVGGMEWTARAKEESDIISAGSKVEICEIQGVKAIVKEK